MVEHSIWYRTLACQYSICHDSSLFTIWAAGSSDPVGISTTPLVSGHAFCIGGYMRKILEYRVESKVCNVCDRAIRYKKPNKHHICSKNHATGTSSKAMEPDAGVKMMVDAITKYNVIYSTIIFDDDSTI